MGAIVQSFAKVVLLGHSFGTALALKLAAEKPGRIAGLVLIGAALPLEKPFRPSVFSLARWLFYLPGWVRALCRAPCEHAI